MQKWRYTRSDDRLALGLGYTGRRTPAGGSRPRWRGAGLSHPMEDRREEPREGIRLLDAQTPGRSRPRSSDQQVHQVVFDRAFAALATQWRLQTTGTGGRSLGSADLHSLVEIPRSVNAERDSPTTFEKMILKPTRKSDHGLQIARIADCKPRIRCSPDFCSPHYREQSILFVFAICNPWPDLQWLLSFSETPGNRYDRPRIHTRRSPPMSPRGWTASPGAGWHWRVVSALGVTWIIDGSASHLGWGRSVASSNTPGVDALQRQGQVGGARLRFTWSARSIGCSRVWLPDRQARAEEAVHRHARRCTWSWAAYASAFAWNLCELRPSSMITGCGDRRRVLGDQLGDRRVDPREGPRTRRPGDQRDLLARRGGRDRCPPPWFSSTRDSSRSDIGWRIGFGIGATARPGHHLLPEPRPRKSSLADHPRPARRGRDRWFRAIEQSLRRRTRGQTPRNRLRRSPSSRATTWASA